jgi:hypothetical protein
LYEYDFGDGWQHELLLEEVLLGDETFQQACVAGQRCCPPEDCGDRKDLQSFSKRSRTPLTLGPTLEELPRVPPARLRTFFRKRRCHYPELVERRLVGIRQAMPAIRDRAVIEAKSAVVKVSAQLIRSLIRGVADLDRKIEEAAAAHPEFFYF